MSQVITCLRNGVLCLAILTLVTAGGCGTQEKGETSEDLGVVQDVAQDVGLELVEVVEPSKDDPDGDGFATGTELQYGTDPYNAASQPPDQDGDKIPDPEDEDIDGDGVANNLDDFPYNAEESVDTDGDGLGNAADADDDDDGYSDELEGEYGTDPLDPTDFPADLDGDGTPDDVDPDLDGDGKDNSTDAFPENPLEWVDTDGDGIGNNADKDDDGDGYADALETQHGTDPLNGDDFPSDLDGDGIPDTEDLDVDGDGVDNAQDAFPQDAQESADTDGDGQGNNTDKDDDGDGYPDISEEKYGSDPLDGKSTPADMDNDLLPDDEDSDIDGDGILNDEDAFPTNKKESQDTDGDGTGDNADQDDDNDGYSDVLEIAMGTNPKDGDDFPGDLDGDGIPDTEDLDLDGDGVLNTADAFPYDKNESLDTDGDGTGNNADLDDDGDGYPDSVESDLGFDPANPDSHPADLDGDGTPDSQDDDIDGDGVGNDSDVFPYDSNESLDSDEDGTGDNGDEDDDNDGYPDEVEADYETDPLDAADHPADLDGDLVPDDADDDLDGDKVDNDVDAFPDDPTETQDTDADGTGDNADTDDDGDGYSDEVEKAMGTDPLDGSVHPTDLDGDGIPDPSDSDVDGDGVKNGEDAFPFDAAESADTDGDGKGDNADDDDDDDGYPDKAEQKAGTDPKDPNDYPDDLDGDGIPDSDDPDADNDGVANVDDAFPKNADEWFDTDGDGVGNNADLDDDGDGFEDVMEVLHQTDPTSPFSYPSDIDGDKIPDGMDPDRDGDGVENALDAFPNDPAEWTDTDSDGTGNNADEDDDGDGFSDELESNLGFDPLDFDSHPGDLDGDGIPDVSDPDLDGDGIPNEEDVFPTNPVEWLDTDGDGIGDYTDQDDDGDGYPDDMEQEYGTDPMVAEDHPADLDGDLIPDDIDDDLDGDLADNDIDAFPEDPTEWADTDGDGTGNNTDVDDDGDGYMDMLELLYKSDPLDALSTPPDIDGDGIPDPEDPDKDGDGVPNIDDAFPSDPDAWEEVMDEGSFGEDYQDQIPPDADPDSFDIKKFSLVRGKVQELDGMPIEEVAVTIMDHPEYGTVYTDAKGEYTVPVNGGLTLTLVFAHEGYTQGQRFAEVPWNDILVLQMLELVPYDPMKTDIFLTGDPDEIVTHTSETLEHPITVALGGDNLMVGETEDGELEITDTIVISATEYTTPNSMPGVLPSTTEFTYCIDLKADGYEDVEFDQPVILWTRDFQGFDVGTLVPTGYYDRDDGKWKPMEDGLVVRLLDLDDDTVVDALDKDDDGQPDDLDGDGLFVDEVGGIENELNAFAGDVYWRVEVIHFSPIDMNWPGSGPPQDAEPPPNERPDVDNPDGDPDENDPCKQAGYSEVDVRSRVLHESIPIPGTDFSLHYSSSWVPGYSIPVDIPASGPSVPASLDSISVKYQLAGLSFGAELGPQPNQTINYLWDGRDFLGNLVNQRMNLSVDVGFTYQAVYYSSPAAAEAVGASFAAMGVQATNINARQPVTLWRNYTYPIYHYRPEVPADAWTVGQGWTPDNYHYYDGTSQSVLLGDGRKVRGDQFGLAIDSFSPQSLPTGVRILDVDSDGVIYYVPKGSPNDENKVMRMAAGGAPELYVAMDAYIGDMAVGPDDNVYVTTSSYLWKVPRKTGVPYILANLYFQFYSCFAYYGQYCQLNVDVDNWGYAFLVSRYVGAVGNSKMAIVSPDGTVLANPVALNCTAFDIAVGAEGRTMVAACKNGPVKKIERDGTVEDLPGWAPMCGQFYGYTDPSGLAVLKDGSVLVADQACNRVRKILPDGAVTVIAGTGAKGFGGDGNAPLAAELSEPSDIVLGPDGAIYVADSGNKRIRTISQVRSVVDLDDGQYAVPIDTGEILVFGEKLELLESRVMTTGQPVRAFEYTETGALAKEILHDGREINFITDAMGKVTEIIGLNGETTILAYNEDGQLAEVMYPTGGSYSFEYYNDGGLLKKKYTPNDNQYIYLYDETGRITKVSDPVGGHTVFSRNTVGDNETYSKTTAGGATTSYVDSEDIDGNATSTVVLPTGAEKLFTELDDGWHTVSVDPDGTMTDAYYGTDPKFETRMLERMTIQSPGGLIQDVQFSRTYDDNANTVTYITSVNGAVTTSVYDMNQNTLEVISPEGRVSTEEWDPDTGVTITRQTADLLPTEFEYDESGRATRVNTGDRWLEYAYDDENSQITITGSSGRQTLLTFDEGRAIISRMREDGTGFDYQYDAAGFLTSISDTQGREHTFTRNEVDTLSTIKMWGEETYTYSYNVDRGRASLTYPDGTQHTTDYSGVLTTGRQVGDFVGTLKYMADGSGRLKSLTSSDGITLSYGYDGSLTTSTAWSGAIAGKFAYTYNDDFDLEMMTILGKNYEFQYDSDGIVTGVGDAVILRSPTDGAIDQITDGESVTTFERNGHADVTEATWSIGGQSLIQFQVQTDNGGVVTQVDEEVNGDAVSCTFVRNSSGWLSSVVCDGVEVEAYEYDASGMRTSMSSPVTLDEAWECEYNDKSQVTSCGPVQVGWDANGFVSSLNHTGLQLETVLDYAPDGRLLSVITGDGTLVEYLHDAMGRRMVRKVAGAVDRKYLWDDSGLLHAVLAADNSVDTRFEYTGGMLPSRLVRGVQVYYLGYDASGSLRIVTDVNGSVVKQVDYDTWGNVVSDSNPQFDALFGYGTGIRDDVTGLLQVGARDYSPLLGQWLAPDPIGPEAGFTPYRFAGNDPATLQDPTGLWEIGLGLFAGVGAKLKIGYKNGTFWWDAGVGVGVGADLDVDFTAGPPINLTKPGFDSQVWAELEGKAGAGIIGEVGGRLRAKDPRPCNDEFMEVDVGGRLLNVPVGKYKGRWGESGDSTHDYSILNPMANDFLVPSMDMVNGKPKMGLPGHFKRPMDWSKAAKAKDLVKVSATANASAGATGVWKIW